jgi:hypothetical protein
MLSFPWIFPRNHRGNVRHGKAAKKLEIIENPRLLSDWLRIKYPDEHFKLVVAGGSAMTFAGFKDQTTDIDLLRPEVLPSSIKNGIAHIGRVRRLGPEWLNTSLAIMLSEVMGTKKTTRILQ